MTESLLEIIANEWNPRKDLAKVDFHIPECLEQEELNKYQQGMYAFIARIPKHVTRGAIAGCGLGALATLVIDRPLAQNCFEGMILGGAYDMGQYLIRGLLKYVDS
jgi:hypothetical protein